MIKFDIDKIASYLIQHKDRIKSYTWKPAFDYRSIDHVIENEIQFPDSTHFDKEVVFRYEVSDLLSALYKAKNTDKFETLALWIVKEWGGIRGIKEIKSTIEKLECFLKADYKNTFDTIATISKIAAFVSSQKYIIYDAKIAYSMNWILLSQDAGNKFFPSNKGRNSRLTAFDIDVLIRLKHAGKYKSNDKISRLDKTVFIDKDKAYPLMNDLVHHLHNKVYPEYKDMPFITEMLLFALADTYIYEEITQKIRLKIG